MSNAFMRGLESATNYTYTENGAITHKTTTSDLLDMFAMGGAYRNRSNEDVILMFQKAFAENPTYALKCLFYLRDVRGGQGERRFFRVALSHLATKNAEAVRRNIEHIPEFGRWDDLYCLLGTPVEGDVMAFIKHQLALDVESKTPSLLAKWLKSINTSSAESRAIAHKTRKYLGMNCKQYRKTLSVLRKRINVLERLMSEGRWDEIEFDKIPSRAGLIYKNAFARHDIERMKSEKAVQSYESFIKDDTKKVNAKTLYPYECVAEVMKTLGSNGWGGYGNRVLALDDINRLAINKYWDNLTDYFNKATFNGICMVDTSASMTWNGGLPIQVATSLGIYCAERCSGPYAGNYISFSREPRLVKVEGVDFYDKAKRIVTADLCQNTDIKKAFDLVLDVACRNKLSQNDIPQNIVVISDMEFDSATTYAHRYGTETLFESIRREWATWGYQMPHLIFWNVNARQNNIPMLGNGPISYVSGFSPSIFETIMSGKTGYDLMMEKLDSERYSVIG